MNIAKSIMEGQCTEKVAFGSMADVLKAIRGEKPWHEKLVNSIGRGAMEPVSNVLSSDSPIGTLGAESLKATAWAAPFKTMEWLGRAGIAHKSWNNGIEQRIRDMAHSKALPIYQAQLKDFITKGPSKRRPEPNFETLVNKFYTQFNANRNSIPAFQKRNFRSFLHGEGRVKHWGTKGVHGGRWTPALAVLAGLAARSGVSGSRL